MTYSDFDDTYWLYGEGPPEGGGLLNRRDYWINSPYFDWLRHIEGIES